MFKWGIMGCGSISYKFIESVNLLKNTTVIAVASKSQERADDLAKAFKIKNTYSSYEEMLSRDDINAVYIATTNNFHFGNIKLALEFGKHVLCEKPMVLCESELKNLVKLAKEKKLLLMEAMWTRFLPAVIELKKALKEEIIGEVKYVTTSFSHNFYADENINPRIINPELGGGGLLDIGVYNLAFIDMIFEADFKDIKSNLQFTYTQVDDTVDALIDYGNNKIAYLHTSIGHYLARETLIVGNEGYIRVPEFKSPSLFQIMLNNQDSQVISMAYIEPGFQYEIESFIESVENNLLSNENMSLESSLRIVKTMDKIRHDNNFYYPNELAKSE